MPTLTYNISQGAHGAILNSRVLIGRRIAPAISLNDPSVSRLHAWIDPVAEEQGEWVITDAGSKAGTLVNHQRITRHHLQDGDVIAAGSVSLLFQDRESLPEDVQPIELTAPPPIVRDDGILFECSCGAPLWVGKELAGKRGLCRHCRKPVTVPGAVADDVSAEQSPPAASMMQTPTIAEIKTPETDQKTDPAAEPVGSVLARETAPVVSQKSSSESAPSKRKQKCAVCHATIVPGEEITTCPDCAMAFHAECWQENLGCSSYGCPQVNCLQPKTAEVLTAPSSTADTTLPDEATGTPWELVLFAASIVGSLLGALMFGGLAVVVALLSMIVLLRKKPVRAGLLIAAILVCIVGIAGGLIASDFWYFDARHLPEMLRHRL